MTYLTVRPARQAMLAADFLQHRRADAEAAAGHIDGQMEVLGKLLDTRLSLGLLRMFKALADTPPNKERTRSRSVSTQCQAHTERLRTRPRRWVACSSTVASVHGSAQPQYKEKLTACKSGLPGRLQ